MDINTKVLLTALEEIDDIISSDDSTDLERDLATALKCSLYWINKNGDNNDKEV